MLLRLGFLAVVTLGVVGLVALASLMIFKSADEFRSCDLQSDAVTIETVDIHWMSWDTLTRYAYAESDVRRTAHKVRRLNAGDDLNCLIAGISKLEMKPDRYGSYRMDGRVLIEATMESGEQITYFADRFQVCIIETGMCAENSEAWQSKISALMGSGVG